MWRKMTLQEKYERSAGWKRRVLGGAAACLFGMSTGLFSGAAISEGAAISIHPLCVNGSIPQSFSGIEPNTELLFHGGVASVSPGSYIVAEVNGKKVPAKLYIGKNGESNLNGKWSFTIAAPKEGVRVRMSLFLPDGTLADQSEYVLSR
jgi:hypothetical protein